MTVQKHCYFLMHILVLKLVAVRNTCVKKHFKQKNVNLLSVWIGLFVSLLFCSYPIWRHGMTEWICLLLSAPLVTWMEYNPKHEWSKSFNQRNCQTLIVIIRKNPSWYVNVLFHHTSAASFEIKCVLLWNSK